MAVQNPFFGKRDNDNFPSRSSVTGLSTANTAATSGASSLSNAGLGTAPSSPMRAAATAAPTAPVAEEQQLRLQDERSDGWRCYPKRHPDFGMCRIRASLYQCRSENRPLPGDFSLTSFQGCL